MSEPAAGLQVTTPGDREITMTRAFDAPRRKVFDHWTQPALLRQWLTGPEGWSMPTCDVDLRVGGAYRFEWRGPGGLAMGMGGVHREVVPPERLVNTQRFDQDWTGSEAEGTLILTEQDGRTIAANTVRYASALVRDAVLASGMIQGVAANYDRLAALLAR